MKPRDIVISILFSLILSSCSIKEDRSLCPTFFSIDFSKIDGNIINPICLFIADNNDRIIYADTIYKSSYNLPYEIELTKGELNLYAWGNCDNIPLKENTLRINKGNQSDKFFFYTKTHFIKEEFSRDTIRLNKNYMQVNVKVLGEALASSGVKIETVSTSAGYYVNGEVIEGVFSFIPNALSTPTPQEWFYSYHFIIPRQKILEELKINISTSLNGFDVKLFSYELGKTLLSQGVFFKSESLPDIDITVDYAHLTIGLKIDGWSSNYPFNITL